VLFNPLGTVVHDFVDPVTTPRPTETALVLTRPSNTQATLAPPTLTRPGEPLPGPTPATRSFTIPLKGGGAMTVTASDRAAAINNVKSQGGEPDEP
jgi:hypothetical protein